MNTHRQTLKRNDRRLRSGRGFRPSILAVLTVGGGLLLGPGAVDAGSPPPDPAWRAGCPGGTLAGETCLWWVQEAAADPVAGAPPALVFGAADNPAREGEDIGGPGRAPSSGGSGVEPDEEEGDGDDGAGGTAGEGPAGEGEPIGGPGRFQVLATWPLDLGNGCAAPILAEVPAGVLICWDQGAGRLCARAFRVTAWAGALPAAGELSEPVCVAFAGPADRARAEAALLAAFTGAADDD